MVFGNGLLKDHRIIVENILNYPIFPSRRSLIPIDKSTSRKFILPHHVGIIFSSEFLCFVIKEKKEVAGAQR